MVYSLIGQFSEEDVQFLWARILTEVQSFNKNAGTISRETIPDDLQDLFKQRRNWGEGIPEKFFHPKPEELDWNQHDGASALAIANLLGAWDENNNADRKIIQKLLNGSEL